VAKLGAIPANATSTNAVSTNIAPPSGAQTSNVPQPSLLPMTSPVPDSTPTAATNLISIDDFKNVQLRTGKVLEAERVPKSDKLLKLQVDLGTEKRQILAGIGKYYTPEEMVGKVVTVVANLKPAKLMGQESQGMLLAANMPDGSLSLVTPEKAGIEAGAEVR
jgi:methionyl-tRNA synthetase